ncbi:hypothetical protein HMPREF1508_1440 [Shuttleworthella sp. MSX8B]|nr:hypothetical protein HMPREF1508_1440 [Shuttleworthia sp. MSX8B]
MNMRGAPIQLYDKRTRGKEKKEGGRRSPSSDPWIIGG